MLDTHPALELPRHNPQEGDPVAVGRVHVRLNFEHIAGKFLVRRFYGTSGTAARLRLRCQLQEVVQEGLHAEIINRTAEEYRCQLTAQHLFIVKSISCHVKQLQILAQLVMQVFPRHLADDRIGVAFYLLHLNYRVVVALEQFHLIFHPVIHAAQLAPAADRPVHRYGADAQHILQLFHQFERALTFAVQLVDERKDRNAPFGADLEQLDRLCFHTFGHVDQHDRTVRSC
ncbi:hypothetical protein D3C75_626180 [compost metagenome]